MPRPAFSPRSAAPVIAALLMLGGMTLLFLKLRPAKPPVVPTAAVVETIGYSVEGRPMVCHRFGNRGPRLLIKASIHGTEGAGTPLARELIRWLEAHPETWRQCTIFVLPVSNPDGLHAGRRFNARGVDLNRNFPAGNREAKARFGLNPLSEPESRALHDFILREKPDVIVAIHQPLHCVDYDGPALAASLASRLAETTSLPMQKLGARPGSLGAWFGETLGRPILTLELPRTLTDFPDKLWADYGPGLVDLVIHPERWTADAVPVENDSP
jgi:murein peptide amidase A